MNFSDSEIVTSIMLENNYEVTNDISGADVIFVNTCSIRDNAEQRVKGRLREFYTHKKRKPNLIIGVLGCMAERLKSRLLEEEKLVDLIVGPDSYRDLPKLMQTVIGGSRAINILLSTEETYADIKPVRIGTKGVSAFISIMRGCENFCSYCVVPYTRGKERSRNPETIIEEAHNLFEKGYREITLLGQNVNSYHWNENGWYFAKLLEKVATINPKLRLRFATSHPKDISDELLYTIAKYDNICKSIHLPVQSGSDRILKLMNRKYTRDWYLNRVNAIKKIIPECTISTDIISGFCSETESDHNDTLSLMEIVGYQYAFMFKYSERPNTIAAKKLKDDVPDKVKITRLQEIIVLQQKLSLKSNKNDVGKTFEVLIEGESKRSENHLSGRNSQNKIVVFPKENKKTGEYANVQIHKCTSATLLGEIVQNNE
ncbi:MAG: tRNA (N6-isopentenyl adenosine(37)-C2)-methylthiotransferase MiaB [Bacteroidales bacterium]|nr:tRNA (N6-isopentenyl adenosine(37)-C2)-methylthiotransferase MiaB [Bacteroidales bacterium]